MAHSHTLGASREAIRRLKAAGSPPKAARRHLLRVPPDTEAFKILCSGSDCYLHVPDLLFPKSRPTLGR